jgi:hypothetical protein
MRSGGEKGEAIEGKICVSEKIVAKSDEYHQDRQVVYFGPLPISLSPSENYFVPPLCKIRF